jgi:hypothetical protein
MTALTKFFYANPTYLSFNPTTSAQAVVMLVCFEPRAHAETDGTAQGERPQASEQLSVVG